MVHPKKLKKKKNVDNMHGKILDETIFQKTPMVFDAHDYKQMDDFIKQ
jgi:hypothetical protein